MFCIAPIGYRLGPHVETEEIVDVTYEELINEIVAILEAVDGIGKVYSFPQHSVYVEKHKELFVTDDDKFHVWWPNRVSWEATGGISVQVFRFHVIEITGHYALSNDNESEMIFQNMINAIADELDKKNNFNLGGTVDQHLPAQMEKTEVMFGGYLCHKAIIRIVAEAEATEQ